MTVFRSLVAGIFAAVLASAPAVAGPRHDGQQRGWQQQQQQQRDDDPRGWPQRDSDRAFMDVQQGRAMPLPQLERRVMPQMPGAEYLGPELNRGTYRLKFMQNGRVIWVDVDSQTGRIIRRSR
jgi:uncharacterized membrane protein YkoI